VRALPWEADCGLVAAIVVGWVIAVGIWATRLADSAAPGCWWRGNAGVVGRADGVAIAKIDVQWAAEAAIYPAGAACISYDSADIRVRDCIVVLAHNPPGAAFQSE